ncbi:hypothetical protein ABID82_005070 [Methylobacterium sp. PvP062]|uniref:Lipoprotein n=1 Tax=Methylobacterium radiotolerans TaxID=31998 RepID=A0ABV2NUM3_9HYPH|nr:MULTISPECIES: hypothetical protein [unclassified Methylobacterium]MBP2498384.1 hypothetical protein [Methylobacterium sp. PvP105]MBP2505768.1 hypothetical protein [Methylobacterium sp. PvP109]
MQPAQPAPVRQAEPVQIRSRDAVKAFCNYWETSERGSQQVERFELFEAEVGISCGGEPRDFLTDVKINPDQEVELIGSGQLRTNDYHLLFNPLYQVYEFDEGTGRLRISGTGLPTKGYMKGPYTVEIYPSHKR